MALNSLGLGFVLKAEDFATGVLDRVTGSMKGLRQTGVITGRALRASFATAGAGAAILGASIQTMGMAAATGIQAQRDFSKAIAEVETIIPIAERNTERLRETTLGLTATYGGEPQDQARALYQTISAGITDTAEATRLLDVANRAAIGGITDVTTVVDGLTTIINSYGLEAGDAERIADELFTTVRLGKTTMEELSRSIGRVTPTASSMGIATGELFSAIAAVTAGGLETSRAVTGLNAALANVRSPTKAAKEEAQRLGVQFNSAAVRAQGLAGFFRSIVTSANFVPESLERMFGAIEGLNVIISLGRENMGAFDKAMGQMRESSGAMQTAYERMSSTLDMAIRRLEGAFRVFKVRIGEVLEPILVPLLTALGGLVEAFTNASPAMQRAVIGIGLLGVALMGVGGAIIFIIGLSGALFTFIGGMILMIPGIIAVAQSLIAVAAAAWPVIAVIAGIGATLVAVGGIITITIGALVGGFALLWAAARENIGGLGKLISETFGKIKLAFHATTQFIRTGGFSEEMDQQLSGAGEPIRRFALRVGRLWERVTTFFSGLRTGFKRAMVFAGPAIDSMVEAFRNLGVAFGIVGERGLGALESITDVGIGERGVRIGELIGGAVEWIAEVLRRTAKFAQGFIAPFAEFGRIIEPAFRQVIESSSELRSQLSGLLESLGLITPSATGADASFRDFGEILGGPVLNGVRLFLSDMSHVISAMSASIETIRTVIGVFRALRDAGAATWGAIRSGFTSMVEAISAAIDYLIARVGRLASIIPEQFRPEFLTGVVEAGQEAERRGFVRERRAAPGVVGVGVGAGVVSPAVAEATGRAAVGVGVTGAEIRSAVETATMAGVQAASARPINVSVEIEGEAIARVTAEQQRSAAEAGFSPVGVGL